MTTITQEDTASPVLCNAVLDALMNATPARRAQFASYVDEAKAGTLSRVRAFGICRQLRGAEAPAQGEDQIKMPKSNGETRSSTRSNDASEAQARFAADLLRTRLLADERVVGTVKTAAELLARFDESGRMDRTLARNVIDGYKDRPRVQVQAPVEPKPAPKAAPVAPKAELEPGIYQVGEDVYKVQRARQSGRLYAQKLVDGQFDYDAGYGALRFLRAEHLMTTEQAKAFGMKFGMCVNGHPLSDRTSRYFGYGQQCAAKNGWAYDKHLVPADFE
jgi:hypothetical protein